MRVIELSTIRIDGGTQPREEIDQKAVDEYAESYAALVKLPPVVVYFDGANAWLADGFHRYHAAKKNGNQAIDVDWREGTLEMAKFFAAGANVAHGLRRKEADKKRAIMMLLETEQGKRWSSERGGVEKVRRHCGVSQAWASEVLANHRSDKLPSRAEKRAAAERVLDERPEAPCREIAAAAGVSHTMVENIRKDRERVELSKATGRPADGELARDSERRPAPEVRDETPKGESAPQDPKRGCASLTERDAADAWVAQGAMLYERFGEGAREYMRTSWDKRLGKLEGY
jgi:hypothetical protein